MTSELKDFYGKFQRDSDLAQLERQMKDLALKYSQPENFDLLSQAN